MPIKKEKDFIIYTSNINGYGGHTATHLFMKTLFAHGAHVTGRSFVPANIKGQPASFSIRVSSKEFSGHKNKPDITIAANPQKLESDLHEVKSGGTFIYDSSFYANDKVERNDVTICKVPFLQMAKTLSADEKTQRRLTNIMHTGVLIAVLDMDIATLLKSISTEFGHDEHVLQLNTKAAKMAYDFFKKEFSNYEKSFELLERSNKGKILIDGNAASALGLIYGGATFAAWYPITPATSLIEDFNKYVSVVRNDDVGKNKYAIIQAEDELAALGMAIGAGWSGARAFTATSGPGLSLMQELIGLSYYAEVPVVIWNVQRAGPSTGMPTRTAQSDIVSSVFASHGDTKIPVLIPGNIKELFEFGQLSLDLSEKLQTAIIALSDLDLALSYWTADAPEFPTAPFERGKVLNLNQLDTRTQFSRYEDTDGDGIAYRTLPTTKHPLSAYYTSGASHDSKSQFTEDSSEYVSVINRLALKWETAKKYVPGSLIEDCNSDFCIVGYGSSEEAIKEAIEEIKSEFGKMSYIRIRSIPFCAETKKFLEKQKSIFVVEQNRDSQMLNVMKSELDLSATRSVKSILHYDGSPLTSDRIVTQLKELILETQKKEDR